jgi:hypothetical protein
MPVEECSNPIPSLESPCNDTLWSVEETLQIEVNGQTLAPRRCEVRHTAHLRMAAVKFEVKLDEIILLAGEDALAWRFTLRRNGALVYEENGWKIGQLDSAGDSTYVVCVERVEKT